MTTLAATPYDTSAPFFYFDSNEEFEEKYAKNQPVEEYEIQYIDGYNSRLFREADINQCNIELWFDTLSHIDDDSDNGVSLSYLLSIGYTLSDALDRADEVQIYRGRSEDYVFEFFNEINDVPANLAFYIDYKQVQTDMEINGELVEFQYEVYITNPQDF